VRPVLIILSFNRREAMRPDNIQKAGGILGYLQRIRYVFYGFA
jgi:hypothetical protein